jgi:hypothetical protein
MYKREVYTISESQNADFRGAPIEYENSLINSLTKDADVKIDIELITDLPYLLMLDPLDESINYDGVVLVAAKNKSSTGFTYSDFQIEQTILDSIDRQNNVLGLALLQNKFYKTRRIFINGKLNNLPTTFDSVLRTKEQKGIKFILCNNDNINFNNGVKTDFGIGKVSKYNWKLTTGEVTVDLLFEPIESNSVTIEKGTLHIKIHH